MAEFVIEEAKSEDLEEARLLVETYTDELGLDTGYLGADEELDNFPGPYAPPRGVILVARRQGVADLVGLVASRPVNEEVCVMKRLYVKPMERRFGLGEKLSLALLDWARDHGYQIMKLDTMDQMTAAIKLYERLGFARCGRFEKHPEACSLYFSIDL
jgi:GNAT superfamily N-acetyltransferase